ncbi:MAG: Nif3-like dinuclear metal center hexameric protein [Saprospiraceae bacterium]
MTKIKEVLAVLEQVAPPSYQESYDNAGLITGNKEAEVTGVLTCLDSTEAIVEEAIAKSCNLIVAHHPIVFKGLKRFTGQNYVERTIIKALKHDIAIYAIHTNLDNVYYQGVNTRFAERLGLQNTQILAPKSKNIQLGFLISSTDLGAVLDIIQPLCTHPAVTIPSNDASRMKIECTLPEALLGRLKAKITPFLKSAITSQTVLDLNPQIGSGMIGELAEPMETKSFLSFLKERMKTKCVKHTELIHTEVKKVALCGGVGSFLLKKAIQQKADIYITGDYKYHEYFDADGKIIIADIGHFETEQFTIPLLKEIISNKFSNFAVYETAHSTNPVHYFV